MARYADSQRGCYAAMRLMIAAAVTLERHARQRHGADAATLNSAPPPHAAAFMMPRFFAPIFSPVDAAKMKMIRRHAARLLPRGYATSRQRLASARVARVRAYKEEKI